MPLIVLTADRPPELRGIGAGQTIDQLKLYGSAARWFCEVGSHEADDAGLLHHRSVACRAFFAAAGDPRPGPVHLNICWRDPLGPEPRPGDLTASSPLALEGRDGERPLTTVAAAPGPAARTAGRGARRTHRVRAAGPDRRRADARPLGASSRSPPWPARPATRSSPSRPRSFASGPTTAGWSSRATSRSRRARPQRLAPELVLRFGEMPTCKPLRQWLADLPEAAQLVVDPDRGWNEPTRIAGAIVRADPARLAAALAGRADGGARSGMGRRLAGGVGGGRRGDRGRARAASRRRPSRGSTLRSAGLYADGDLVYTASSMPIRDQEAFLAGGPAEVRFLANRGANGIDGLISSGIGAAAATGRPTWIVTGDLGLFHDMNALAALRHAEVPVRIVVLDNDGGGIFEFLPQAAQIDPRGVRGDPRHAARPRRRAGRGAARASLRTDHRSLATRRGRRLDGADPRPGRPRRQRRPARAPRRDGRRGARARAFLTALVLRASGRA